MPDGFDLSWWGFRAGASFCRPISGCKPVGEAEVDSLCAAMHVLPVSSFLRLHQILQSHGPEVLRRAMEEGLKQQIFGAFYVERSLQPGLSFSQGVQ
jgi:hypothetical protein